MKKLIRVSILFLTLFCSIQFTHAFFTTSSEIVNSFHTKGYNIKLNANGGTFNSSYNVIIDKNKTTLPTPSRNGYAFLGYSFSTSGNVEFNTNISDVTKIDNKHLYAKWSKNTYTITYTLNGGTISGQKTSYTVEDSFTLVNPTKTGYTFAGWTGSDGSTKQTSVTVPKGTTGNLNYTANWNINSYQVDINSIVDGTTYSSGKSGYTFSVWVNGSKVATNVVDWSQKVNYGTKVRVVANAVSGYNITANGDQTITVGTSNVTMNPTWLDNIGPTITGYSVSGMNWYGYNSNYGYNTYNYNLSASATDVNGVAKICYSFWSNNSNRWLDAACHSGGSSTEPYENVIEGWRITKITAYDNRGNISSVDYGYNVP